MTEGDSSGDNGEEKGVSGETIVEIDAPNQAKKQEVVNLP